MHSWHAGRQSLVPESFLTLSYPLFPSLQASQPRDLVVYYFQNKKESGIQRDVFSIATLRRMDGWVGGLPILDR